MSYFPPLPVDAFPADVEEAIYSISVTVEDLLHDSDYYQFVWLLDEKLVAAGPPNKRVSYLCKLTAGHKGVTGFLATCNVFPSYLPPYTTWLALRLTEAVCSHAGNARIRGWRKDIASEWDASRGCLRRITEDANVDLVLHFLFSVLVPQIASPIPKKINDITEQVRQAMPRPTIAAQPKTKSKPSQPQALQALCEPPFSTEDVRDLLTALGVLSKETGRWHLGTLTGKAGKPKSAFPAAYKALTEAKLMRRVDAPVWRKIFEGEFEVVFCDRVANYAWGGTTSAGFDAYYIDARRWVTRWKGRE